jgi:hypothetical protein
MNEFIPSIQNCEKNNSTLIIVVVKLRYDSGRFYYPNVFPIYSASAVGEIPHFSKSVVIRAHYYLFSENWKSV